MAAGELASTEITRAECGQRAGLPGGTCARVLARAPDQAQGLKRRYDPTRLFRVNFFIDPAAAGSAA